MTDAGLIGYTEYGRMAKHSSVSVEHYTPALIVDPSRHVLGDIDLDPASCHFANRLVEAKRIYTEAADGLKQEWIGRVFLNPPGSALKQPDRGTRSSMVRWYLQLVESYERDQTETAIFVGFSLELLQTAQTVQIRQPLTFPCCIPKKRIPFDVLADDLIRSLRVEQRKILGLGRSIAQQKKIIRLEERIEELEPRRGERVAGEQPTHANVIVYLPPVGQDARRAGTERFREAFAPVGYVHVPGDC